MMVIMAEQFNFNYIQTTGHASKVLLSDFIRNV